MVSAIGSAPAAASADPTPGVSTAGIEAQIAHYKKQLSDCVNCESAKTLEGKAAIQAISNKISAAEARIEQITTAKSTAKPSVSGATTVNKPPTSTGAVASSVAKKVNVESAPTSQGSDSSKGSLVDVFA